MKLNKKAIITDPCYPKDTWCQLVLNVKAGNYRTICHRVDTEYGTRNSVLMVVHESCDQVSWEFYGKIGVDSGQAGIFQYDNYPLSPNRKWYKEVGEYTQLEDKISAEDVGVISSSGYGDGLYFVFVARKKRSIVGIAIDFNVIDNINLNQVK